MLRVNLSKTHPEAYRHVEALSAAADAAARKSGLDDRLIELVKIRVSQINGCAFCLRLHTRAAIEIGETNDRLAVLAAWWESQYFSEVEAAALAIADQVTLLKPHADAVNDPLTSEQVSAVSWVALVVNAWNRVAVSSGYPVGP